MKRTLYVGFKGKNNASCALVKSVSADSCLLTNSMEGVKRDIERLGGSFDCAILFGVDKKLNSAVRIETLAEKETEERSCLKLESISTALKDVGIPNFVSDTPTQYLCNEAYWHLLRKFGGRAVLIHIPTAKNASETMMERLACVFESLSL